MFGEANDFQVPFATRLTLGAGNDGGAVLIQDANGLQALRLEMDGGGDADSLAAEVALGPQPDPLNGPFDLRLNGGGGDDELRFSLQDTSGTLGQLALRGQTIPSVDVGGGRGNDAIEFLGATGGPDPGTYLSFVRLNGESGNDRLTPRNPVGLPEGLQPLGPIISGGPGNDFVYGSDADELLFGSDGDDVMDGGGGDDTIHGGKGNDMMTDGTGSNTLYGEADNDTMITGTGSDVLIGGKGNDQLRGGDGRDYLEGGTGKDKLLGEDDRDILVGGLGADWLEGGDESDVLCDGLLKLIGPNGGRPRTPKLFFNSSAAGTANNPDTYLDIWAQLTLDGDEWDLASVDTLSGGFYPGADAYHDWLFTSTWEDHIDLSGYDVFGDDVWPGPPPNP